MIVNWPAQIKPGSKQAGSFVRQPSHLVDIMATCLDLAGTQYPTKFEGKSVGPPRGISLVPHFKGVNRDPHEKIFFSFYGKNNALRVGDWKLVNINFQGFELYNVAQDRTELNDLAKSRPEKFSEMKELWNRFSAEVGEKKRSKEKKRKKDK